VAFGKWCFYINSYPEGSKISRYESLKQVEKSRGVTPPELLNAPTLLWQHDDCWTAYTSLKNHTWLELESYMRLTGRVLDPWEIEAIMELAKHKV
jgi:hypothetical protein